MKHCYIPDANKIEKYFIQNILCYFSVAWIVIDKTVKLVSLTTQWGFIELF